MSDMPLLEVRDLKVHFPIRAGLLGRPKGWVRAVDGVSFAIRRGETLALVGESGCGKSTTGYAALGMVPTTAGHVLVEGRDLAAIDATERRALARRMQIVFQDPASALNPRMRVGDSIAEPLVIHATMTAAQRRARVAELLDLVGLRPEHADRMPDAFSGGQRQRLVIARALALEPSLIVCDEAVSALDVSVQSQVLNLFLDLQQRLGLAYLFISHDLGVVRHLADRVAVMYLGRIVETADTDTLFARPAHPYTRALLGAAPRPDPGPRPGRTLLVGDIPSPAAPPPGCRFSTRCPLVRPACSAAEPPLERLSAGHWAACPFIGEDAAAS
jgi:peptide/nickel transport system ATP-binding protein/oligopeptide transport system ATP-binding protein